MRLLFLSSSFPNPLSAARGTFNRSLMQALAAEHEVRVVSPVSWLDELAARLKGRRLGERTAQLGPRLHVTYPRFYYPPRVLHSSSGSFLWWSIGRAVRRQLADFEPDAIVSYWAHPDGEAAVRAGREANVPVVAMVGGSDVLLLARQGSRRRAILNVLNAADAVAPVSGNIANVLLDDGLPESRIEVIPRGVDRSVFSPGDRAAARSRLGIDAERPLLVAVGRLVEVKGFDVLIEACRQAADRVPGLRCCILGGGPLHNALAAQIRQAGLSESVRLLGSKNQAELADWYRAANFTVLTSHSEGIPNVLLESLACGTPFIATRVGSVPDIADERLHSLVPPNNPPALAEAIARRLTADTSRNLTPRFIPPSWEDSAKQLTVLIERLRHSVEQASSLARNQSPAVATAEFATR